MSPHIANVLRIRDNTKNSATIPTTMNITYWRSRPVCRPRSASPAASTPATRRDGSRVSRSFGEASDSRNFETLLDIGPGIAPRAVVADKGYDAAAKS